MKNRLSALAAATALCAIMTAPAAAGYSIYVDSALPSVLFVEFDPPPEGAEPAVISAPNDAADVVVIGPGAGMVDAPDPSDSGSDNGTSAEESTDNDEIDLEPTPQNLIEDAMRDEIFRDIELR